MIIPAIIFEYTRARLCKILPKKYPITDKIKQEIANRVGAINIEESKLRIETESPAAAASIDNISDIAKIFKIVSDIIFFIEHVFTFTSPSRNIFIPRIKKMVADIYFPILKSMLTKWLVNAIEAIGIKK